MEIGMPQATGTKSPALKNLHLLGKRDDGDRSSILRLLEMDSKMRADLRERFSGMLFLDFDKMNSDQQSRFIAIMKNGTPDEKRRIECQIEKKK